MTIIRDAAGTLVTMNRDEAKDRQEAGPRRWGEGEDAYLAPADLKAGGAWIGVNAHGVCVCLLNRYDPVPPGSVSRGEIVRRLMEAGAFEDAVRQLPAFAHGDYSPFTVVLVEADRGLRFDWTGRNFGAETLNLDAPVVVTSSSWNGTAVSLWRRRYFEACLSSANDNRQALAAFHAVAPAGMAAWAPFVERDLVFTTSIAQVALGPRLSTLRYWTREALSSGLGDPDQALHLPRARGAAERHAPTQASTPSRVGGARPARAALATAARRYGPLLLILAALVAVYASGWSDALSLDRLQRHQAQLSVLVSAHPPLAIASFAAAYALVTALSAPGAAIMTLAGGLLFGPWVGGAASLAGATVGATAVYVATRSAFGEPLRRRAERQGGALRRMTDAARRDGLSYILTARLIPVLPFWLVNIAAGVAGVPLRAYVLGSLVGMAPATFVYAWTGAGLGRLFARGAQPDLRMLFEPQLLGPLTALGLLSLAPVLVRQLRRRAGAGA